MSEKREVIERIIETLERDLKDRQGMWENIAADVEEEIRSEWHELLGRILERETESEEEKETLSDE